MVLTSRQFARLMADPAFRKEFPEFGLQYQDYDREQALRRQARRCSACGAGKSQFRKAVAMIQAQTDLAKRLKTHLAADKLQVIDRSTGKAVVKTIV